MVRSLVDRLAVGKCQKDRSYRSDQAIFPKAKSDLYSRSELLLHRSPKATQPIGCTLAGMMIRRPLVQSELNKLIGFRGTRCGADE